MVISARFKGKDGSLGYRNGQRYYLEFGMYGSSHSHFPNHLYIHLIGGPKGGRGLCVYSSLDSLTKNWEVL